MKLTAALTFSALAAALAVGCSLMNPHASRPRSEKPVTPVTNEEIAAVLEAGVAAYNDGDTTAARENLKAVLQATRDKPMPAETARAHFYLAAVAWDLGDAKGTDRHLRACRSLQPEFEPDWTFLAPALRERYESLK